MMSLDRMKAIDLWLGLPLCAIVGLLLRGWETIVPRSHAVPAKPRRILVMKFFGLGSVVLAGPMLRAIRHRYPDSTLTFLAFGPTAELMERMELCDEVWRLRTDGILRFGWDVLHHVIRCARTGVDVCIDLEFFSKFSTLMSALSLAQVRVAFHLNSFWRSAVVTHPVYYNYYRHVTDVYAHAARAIDATVDDVSPCRLTVDEADLDRCRERLRSAGWNGEDRLVGVNVNAGELSFERRWPRERFAELVARVVETPGVCVVLSGTGEESEYVDGIVAELEPAARSRVLNMAGQLRFGEFIASMDLYDFFLTNDSGPLHLAYSQGVDTISLWGPGRPSFYGPLIGNHSTFYKYLRCSPCLYMFTSQVGQWCEHRADCMQAIEVDEVWHTVQNYLTHPGAERSHVAVSQGW